MKIRNRIGFHFGSGSTATGWQSYIDRLDAAGIPATLMSTGGEGLGDIVRRWDNGSTVPHLAVIRCMTHNDVPRYDLPIANAVTDWLTRYVPTIGPDVKRYHTRVITKHGNELDKNRIEWLADFYTALHPVFLAQMGWTSHRICVFSFASGEPEPAHWESILPFLTLCGNNPDKFVIGLHEYSYDETSLLNSYPWLIGRVKALYDICDAHGIKRPLTCAHEFGWKQNKIASPTTTAVSQIDAAMAMYADIGTEWLGGGIWTLQPWQDSGINNEVQKLIEPITELTLDRWYETEGTAPPPTLPKIVILKKPQLAEFTLAQNQAAGEWAYKNYGRTTTHSDNDMATMLKGGDKATSYAVIANPLSPSQAGAIAWCKANGYRYEVLTFSDAPAYTRLNVPHLSQNGTGANARINDCGAACTAMVVRTVGKTPTVDAVAIAYQNPPDSNMTFEQIKYALNGYGMDGTRKRPYAAKDISTTVLSGKPVIALVWYQALPQKFSTFNGSHFIAVYGGNGVDLLYRDPLATNGNELHITFAQFDNAMALVTQSGNLPNQAMDCVPKVTTGLKVDIRPYFEPSNNIGQFTVFSWLDGSKTQNQQLQKIPDGTIALVKGNDYERWRFQNTEMQRGEDTSMGGGLAYTQNWCRWLPQSVTVGATYSNSPRVTVKRRSDCGTVDESLTTDYLTIYALHASWVSPANRVLSFQNVLEVHWRKSPNGEIQERYFIAPRLAYVAWGRLAIEAAISELPQGRPALPWQSWGCG